MIFMIFNYFLSNVLTSFPYLLIFLICNLIIVNLLYAISSFNPVYTVLFLVVAFINLSLFLLVLGIKFIAFMILLIYAGAVSILVMFVLMMLNLDLLLSQSRHMFIVPLFLYCFLLFVELGIFIVYGNKMILYTTFIYMDWSKIFYIQSELLSLGIFIYNYNQISVVLVSLILLTALIGSISLVSEKRPLKKQLLSVQLKNNKFTIAVTK